MSQRVWGLPGDEAFLAGLLQDIGMLALIQDLGAPTSISSNGSLPKGIVCPGWSARHSVLTYRAECRDGGILGPPTSIARAIALPQDGRSEIQRSPHEKTLTQIVHVAERLTEFLLQGRAVMLSEVIDLMERTPRAR